MSYLYIFFEYFMILFEMAAVIKNNEIYIKGEFGERLSITIPHHALTWYFHVEHLIAAYETHIDVLLENEILFSFDYNATDIIYIWGIPKRVIICFFENDLHILWMLDGKIEKIEKYKIHHSIYIHSYVNSGRIKCENNKIEIKGMSTYILENNEIHFPRGYKPNTRQLNSFADNVTYSDLTEWNNRSFIKIKYYNATFRVYMHHFDKSLLNDIGERYIVYNGKFICPAGVLNEDESVYVKSKPTKTKSARKN